MNQTIDSVVDGVLNEFRSHGYTQRSVQSNAHTFHTIMKMHGENGVTEYGPEIIATFLSDIEIRYKNGKIHRIRYMHLIKCAEYLRQFHDDGCIDVTNRNISTGLNPYYEDILHCIKDYPDWNDKTKRSVRQFSMPYMKWLAINGNVTFDTVDVSVIRSYLIDCTSRMSLNSIDTVKRVLKKLHWFLYISEILKEDFHRTFSFVTPTEYKIKKPADSHEVAQVLSVIDRTTAIGKRDYAVILLATVTGLRSIDIVELTFDEIDWINGEIIITQSKTGNQVALPLTKDVGTALEDYILNGRPQSLEPYVFLRVKSPFTQMGRSISYMIYNGYRVQLGLENQPFHGLRRALGTYMVIAGIPVTTVAQVLGHSSIEPTKQYISLDSINLKHCALELDVLEVSKGGDL